MCMRKFKNIIFDLGNVILDIDTELSKKAFEKEGVENFDKLYTLAYQAEVFDRLEIGAISEKEFYSEIREITGSSLSDNQIRDCWNALIIDYNMERIEFLQKTRTKYKTFILSNTNEIHYKLYTEILLKKYEVQGLESLVDKAYFSHKIGLKKPDPEAFYYIINNAGIKINETLFIDDNQDHIKSAAELGFKTLLLNNKKLEDLNL